MKTLDFAPQQEDQKRYDLNAIINEMIHFAFQKSLRSFNPILELTVAPLSKIISTVDSPFHINPTTTIPCGDLDYGTTTLRESGCAVFCFHQGLSVQGIYCDLDDLSDEITKKGYYYEPKNSTWHSLFDHYGLRRATHYMEIVDSLRHSSICTCLVKNSVYHNDPERNGNHFVNVVGLDKTKVCIDDSHIGRSFFDFEEFLNSVLVAWIW